MSYRLRAALLALLLVTLASPAAATVGPNQGTVAQQATPTATPPVDQTTIRIQLQSNGGARWIITTRFNVSNQSEQDSFNDTAKAFIAGETETLGLKAFRQASEAASRSTGRQMRIENVERNSSHNRSSVSVSFTWTNFARVEGETLHIDDVYETDGGSWFNGLEENQVLIVELPPDAGVRSAPKQVQNGLIVWEGPAEFTGDDLHLAYSQQEPITTTQRTESPNRSDTSPGRSPGGEENRNAILWGSFFAIGLSVAVVSVYMLSRRGGDGSGGEGTQDGPDAGSPPATASQEPDQAGTTDDTSDEIDEKLLSDEERVERLLEQNDGRMKQANIVKETGWSNAKVSQLLSAMAEDDRIDKLRIGRENLISFPDEDVTDIED